MLRVTLILLLVFFGGCKERDSKKPVADTKVSKINRDVYYIPPKPKPKKKPAKIIAPPPEPPLTEDDLMNNDIDAVLTIKAAQRLGNMRKRAYEVKMVRNAAAKEIKPEVKKSYHLQDKKYDYATLKLERDVASLPVNRDRVLTSERVIPAILAEGINSQSPGKVTVVVDRAILSPTLKYILLPVYTKITCQYKGLQKTGQTRLVLTCNELMRPDGSRAKLNAVSAGDMSGKEGLIGDVDNRVWQQYGGSLLVATISALGSIASNGLSDAVTGQIINHQANEFSKISTKILEKNLDLRPVMRIEAGTRIILKPTRDIVFPEATVEKNPFYNQGEKN